MKCVPSRPILLLFQLIIISFVPLKATDENHDVHDKGWTLLRVIPGTSKDV